MDTNMQIAVSFLETHPLDAVRVLEQLDVHNAASFLKEAPLALNAEIFGLMDADLAARCMVLMDTDRLVSLVERLPLEIACTILRKLDSSVREAILAGLSDDVSVPLKRALIYPDGTAGSLMNPQVLTLPGDIQVEDALKRLKQQERGSLEGILVVDRNHILSGTLEVSDLLFADSQAIVSTLMRTDVPRLSAKADRLKILSDPGWLTFHTLPVVGDKGVLLGTLDYKAYRRLEQSRIRHAVKTPMNETIEAFGELFWLGLSGFVKGTVSSMSDG